jgi:PAS domain S-box-containing protein
MTASQARPNPQDRLRLVVEGTACETGREFFRALVRNLATALDTSSAWVTEYVRQEQKLRALAMWHQGAFVEHYEYCLKDTPCAPVIEKRTLVHIPDRIIELYPGDNDLKPMQAVSYMGVPLFDTDGKVMGHLSVMDTKPMPRDPQAVALFEVFAARAEAEHRRLQMEQALREREEQLSLLLQSAMDAILVLDGAIRVVRVNPAAARLLGGAEADLVGAPIGEFLASQSAAAVETFVREIASRPEGRQQLWVPQDFVVRRRDQTVFPAEATLSRFESRGRTFHTLILRNVNDRLEAERQIQLLTQETEYLREAVRDVPGHGDLLGRSDAMQAVYAAIHQVGRTDTTVLVTGETGTGKELVARSIHRASDRADRPLVLVNCAAIPSTLIESEFFGHERGAFTGAVSRREGRFSLANGGTIFLDEIGELPLELQAKLLRVLQEGEFEPLGGTKTFRVNVRVVAATNRDLKQMCADGIFRDDLYFRLSVFPVHLPALREREHDVELLAIEFVKRFARRMGKRIHPLAEDQLKRLRAYDWPGNVRELQNVIERAVILSKGSRLELERAMGATGSSVGSPMPLEPDPTDRILTAKEWLELERVNLRRALQSCGWRVAGERGAARLLGIPPSTLSSRIKALGIQKPS